MTQQRRKPVGGILEIGMSPAANLAEVRCDDVSGCCTGIAWHDASRVIRLRLTEERSGYVERIEAERGVASVAHELTIVVDGDAGRELLDAGPPGGAPPGMVALVTFATGERRLVGWSRRFAAEQSLRLRRLRLDSGARRTEAPTAEAIFESTDTAPAITLTDGAPA